jgi:hypothetical protein
MNTRWVIFRGPQQHSGSGTRYYDQNGSITSVRRNAIKFYSCEDARDWTIEKNIPLSATTYIGQQEFSQADLSEPGTAQ